MEFDAKWQIGQNEAKGEKRGEEKRKGKTQGRKGKEGKGRWQRLYILLFMSYFIYSWVDWSLVQNGR